MLGRMSYLRLSTLGGYKIFKSGIDTAGDTPSANINGIVSIYKPTFRITNPFLHDVHHRLWTAYCKSHPITFDTGTPLRGGSKRTLLSTLGKIGHGGTLDPMAQGILVVGLGSGTKKLSILLQGPKSYMAIMKLGEQTDTLDATGTIVNKSESLPMDVFDPIRLEEVTRKFIGSNIPQIPPKYLFILIDLLRFSALKINGIRACDLLRRGIELPELEARPITINDISILEINPPFISISVDCLGGTYIRSLMRDIAMELGTFGTLTFLERTSVGPFHVQGAIRDLSIFENDLEVVKKLAEQGANILDKYLYLRQDKTQM